MYICTLYPEHCTLYYLSIIYNLIKSEWKVFRRMYLLIIY